MPSAGIMLAASPPCRCIPDPVYAVGLFRHAGAYFGDADAQYQLGRLYLAGSGVEKNETIAANWLAMAARKQHPGAQAVLGDMLWRGEGVSQRQVRGLALLMLANENAKTSADDAEWIGQRYQETVALADKSTRKQAEALLPTLGGPRTAAAAVKIPPSTRGATPPTRTLAKPAQESSLSAMDEPAARSGRCDPARRHGPVRRLRRLGQRARWAPALTA